MGHDTDDPADTQYAVGPSRPEFFHPGHTDEYDADTDRPLDRDDIDTLGADIDAIDRADTHVADRADTHAANHLSPRTCFTIFDANSEFDLIFHGITEMRGLRTLVSFLAFEDETTAVLVYEKLVYFPDFQNVVNPLSMVYYSPDIKKYVFAIHRVVSLASFMQLKHNEFLAEHGGDVDPSDWVEFVKPILVTLCRGVMNGVLAMLKVKESVDNWERALMVSSLDHMTRLIPSYEPSGQYPQLPNFSGLVDLVKSYFFLFGETDLPSGFDWFFDSLLNSQYLSSCGRNRKLLLFNPVLWSWEQQLDFVGKINFIVQSNPCSPLGASICNHFKLEGVSEENWVKIFEGKLVSRLLYRLLVVWLQKSKNINISNAPKMPDIEVLSFCVAVHRHVNNDRYDKLRTAKGIYSNFDVYELLFSHFPELLQCVVKGILEKLVRGNHQAGLRDDILSLWASLDCSPYAGLYNGTLVIRDVELLSQNDDNDIDVASRTIVRVNDIVVEKVDEDALFWLFSFYGVVKKVRILESKAMAHVQMTESSEAILAVKHLQGTPFCGQILNLSVENFANIVDGKRSKGGAKIYDAKDRLRIRRDFSKAMMEPSL